MQLLKSRLPLRNLAFPNKFGKKIAVEELPVQCVSHMLNRSAVHMAWTWLPVLRAEV